MRLEFKDKWAIIVGGSKGIGFALAKEFLTKGSQVLLIARDEKKLLSAQKDLLNLFPSSQVKILSADASNFEDLNFKLTEKIKNGIQPYFLMNCAGQALPKEFENISSAQMQETFQLNVMTAWNSIQILLPYLKKSGGHIVNTSSVAGFLGVYGYADYSVTKFGLIGLSEVLRSELEPYGIKVSVLCPPDTDTPGFEEENKTKPKETAAISAGAKLESPELVARKTLVAMQKGKFMILVNFESKLTYWLKRFFPEILFSILQKTIRKVKSQDQSV